MTEFDLREALEAMLYGESIEDTALEVDRIRSFGEAGLLTDNEGLVITTSAGDEFQITIVQSK